MLHDKLSRELKIRLNLDFKLVLYWQPKISVFNGEITGAEALLRGIKPNGDLVYPLSIIEHIDEADAWRDIGYAIFKEVLEFAEKVENVSKKDLVLAFNMHADQVSDPGLADFVAEQLNLYKVNPRLIEIELTESAIIKDVDLTIATLRKLTTYGLRVAIDDFGTGYSSFAYVQQLPISTLKIDKSFIDDCPLKEKNVQIYKAIVQMSKALRFKTIAEGVETVRQAQFLDTIGCDEIQGWLFSKAVSDEDFIELVKSGRTLDYSTHKYESRKLLLVDDEENILSALYRTLRKEGYTIERANSAEEALDMLSDFKPDVIVSDQRMPNMTGVEMFRRIKTLHPDAIRIILSGYTELDSVTSAINDGAVWKFLTKPWDEELLKNTIKDAFVTKEMRDENARLQAEVEMANQELQKLNIQLTSALSENQHSNEILETQLFGYQNIIDAIPVPAIGVSEGMIVFANVSAKTVFKAALLLDSIHDYIQDTDTVVKLDSRLYTINRVSLDGDGTSIISLTNG